MNSRLQTPDALPPRNNPFTHCIGGWVDLRAGLDVNGESLLSVPEFEPRAVLARGLDVRSCGRRKCAFCSCFWSLTSTRLTVCVLVWSYWSFWQPQQAGKSLGLVLGEKKLTWSVFLTYAASYVRIQLKRRRRRWYQEPEGATGLIHLNGKRPWHVWLLEITRFVVLFCCKCILWNTGPVVYVFVSQPLWDRGKFIH